MQTPNDMPRPHLQRTSVGTLGEIKRSGHKLLASCNPCNHIRTLDLDSLITSLGDDFHVANNRPALLARLKCDTCQRAASGIILEPPPLNLK